jgi:hypothetical protein
MKPVLQIRIKIGVNQKVLVMAKSVRPDAGLQRGIESCYAACTS